MSITTNMQHFFDMGISYYNMKESAKGKVSEELFPKELLDMHECMSDTVVMQEPGFQAASDNNFASIAQLCLILLFISTVCLVCEIVVKKLKSKRRIRPFHSKKMQCYLKKARGNNKRLQDQQFCRRVI